MAKKKSKKAILLIIDGWGIAPPDDFNAIDNANTPNIDRLIRDYPNVSLKTDGEAVGLMEGQFGTSEINHLTIGAGRVIMQDLPKINHSIATGEFENNAALTAIYDHVRDHKSRLHLIGIVSDGGVHSHIAHLTAILQALNNQEFSQPIYIHVFSDGRDVAPRSVEKYLSALEKKIAELPNIDATVVSLQGRYFLDRDRDWDTTEKAFQLINKGEGEKVTDWQAATNLEYNHKNQDEYFGQYIFDKSATLKKGDGVIMFHFRTDRQYQLLKRIFNEDIQDLKVASFVKPSDELTDLYVAFPRSSVDNTLAEVLSQSGKTQLHVAETEKYNHVTYFFDGENEKELPGETWHMFESNRLIKPRYSYEPSMRNFDITKHLVAAIEAGEHDFILANYSSPDMVGHTGNYNAAVVSAESVDYCMGIIYEAVKDKLDEYVLMITADHGNSEIMWDYDADQPHTQHTLSKVPFIMVTKDKQRMNQREALEDIAPTILDILGLEKPEEMTGVSLLS